MLLWRSLVSTVETAPSTLARQVLLRAMSKILR